MAMTEHAYSYEAAQSFESRRMKVLDGSAARARANARRGRKVKLAIGVIAVLVYLLSIVFVEAKISIVGTQINSINSQIAELQEMSARQDLTIGELSSNARIESYAITYLGMEYPSVDSVYYLNKESSLAIAEGRAALNNEPDTTVQPEEQNKWWAAINDFVGSFFYHTAVAAVVEE